MQLTKELEAEIRLVMDTYWNSYLAGDINTWASYLAEDYKNIGTTEEEVWNSKQDIVDYTHGVLHQLTGSAEVRNKNVQIIPIDPYIMVHEYGDMFLKSGDDWMFYAKIRLSTLLEHANGTWKILHQHGSYPDSHALQGETFGFDKLKRENNELREAVQRRTIDLEIKNRELEIEAALERVRSRTMAMQFSSELNDVIAILYSELRKRHQSLDRCFIMTFDPDNLNSVWWMASGDKADYQSGLLVPYAEFKPQIAYLNAWKDKIEKWTYDLNGKEKLDWTHHVFQKTDLKKLPEIVKQNMLNAESVHLSGSFKNFGCITTGSFEPLSEQVFDLLVRFAVVFDQTYTRFTDLQKAEAQAREAQIEVALERLRLKTFAMRDASELRDVAMEMRIQLGKLDNQGLETCAVNLYEEDPDQLLAWGALKPPESQGQIIDFEMQVPKNGLHIIEDMLEHYQKGDEIYSTCLTGERGKQWMEALKTIHPEVYEVVGDSTGYNLSGTVETWWSLVYFDGGALFIITGTPPSETTFSILKRFAVVFGLAYQRSKDLRKAQAQAREAQIELGLERVRAKTMAMHNSEDVGETASIMVEELRKLGIETLRCGIGIMHEPGEMEVWTIQTEEDDGSGIIIGTLDMQMHPLLHGAFENWRQKGAQFSYVLKDDDLIKYYEAINNYPGYPIRYDLSALPSLIHHNEFYFPEGVLFAFSLLPLEGAQMEIFKRFAGIFGQTYRRYLDLIKAESQAREAQIEAALERVRSRSMAMHSSEELKEVIEIVYQQFLHLNVNIEHTGFIVDVRESDDMHIWLADQYVSPFEIRIPYFDSPHWNSFVEAKKTGTQFFTNLLSFEEKNRFYQDLFALIPAMPDESRTAILGKPGLAISTVLLKNVGLYIENLAGVPYTDEENAILMRFGKVFEQTYTRFLDLQKAEEQKRESQIETALEKIRSRSLAMHSSQELKDIIEVVFERMKELDVLLGTVAIWQFDIASGNSTFWLGNDVQKGPAKVELPYDETLMNKDGCLRDAWQAKTNGEDIINKLYDKPLKDEYFEYVFANNDVDTIPEGARSFIRQAQHQIACLIVQKNAALFADSWTGRTYDDAQIDILRRVSRVFEQAYVRFLDLQKAEAQARESKIEAALESVRSKAMSMRTSEDIAETTAASFEELKKLGIFSFRSGVGILTKGSMMAQVFADSRSTDGQLKALSTMRSMEEHPALRQQYQAWEQQKDYEQVLFGEELISYYNHQFFQTSRIDVHGGGPGKTEYGYYFAFPDGLFYSWSFQPYTESEKNILHRFRNIIALTFRRYLDLQKAEEQAREAIKQASLDRVRAVIASMRSADDLEIITPLIFKELTILGVPFIRCGVFIIHEGKESIEAYLSSPDGHALGVLNLPYQLSELTFQTVEAWRKGQIYKQHWNKEDFMAWTKQMMEQHQIQDSKTYQGTEAPPESLELNFVPFTQGMLYVGAIDILEEKEIELVQSLANAFSIAYARYEDFIKLEGAKTDIEAALTELKATQSQLVQQEKLASLGQLTAGIAHEIKNPLNFVNNFSELNLELIQEAMEEIRKSNASRDETLIDGILTDIQSNLQKVHEHGSRANGIVNSMLQHSRGGSGQMEPTKLNAFLKEYVHFCIQAMRAGKHPIPVEVEWDLSEDVGDVPLIREDFSRVIVNISNNAFDAMRSKIQDAGTKDNSYVPLLSIRTQKEKNFIRVSFQDNGPGISGDIKDKILQPFFTTKKGTEGTGLGLSITHDIIKAHGGEFLVETTEGNGSTFAIHLPYQV